MTISGTTVIHVAIILVAKKCAINAKGVVAYEENQAIFIMNAQIASEPRTANITSEFLLDERLACCAASTYWAIIGWAINSMVLRAHD